MIANARTAALAVIAVLATPGLAGAQPTGAGFELRAARVKPATALFDGRREATARFTFGARRRLDLVVRVVREADDRVVRRYVRRDLRPGRFHEVSWDGRRGDGGVAGDGLYRFRVGPAGHRGASAGRLHFHDHVFPVSGPHTYGDVFGAPRSGGRVHEGQDLPAPCGTPLVAARGGRIASTGYSDALYGHWVLVDGLATDRDYFYAHLPSASPLHPGDRVRTGQRIGEVGKSGNARGEFCQLHFELWPRGYRNAAPEDPAPALRRWDDFS